MKLKFDPQWITDYETKAIPNPWIKIDLGAIQKCLGFMDTEKTVKFIENNIPVFNAESVLNRPQYFGQLLAYHKKRKQRLGRISNELCDLFNEGQETITIIPDQKALSDAIDNIESMLLCSSLLIDKVELLVSAIGFNPNKPDKCRNAKVWNKSLFRCVESLQQEGFNQTNACRKTAEIFALIYPLIWGSDNIEDNAAMIQKRLYRKDTKH